MLSEFNMMKWCPHYGFIFIHRFSSVCIFSSSSTLRLVPFRSTFRHIPLSFVKINNHCKHRNRRTQQSALSPPLFRRTFLVVPQEIVEWIFWNTVKISNILLNIAGFFAWQFCSNRITLSAIHFFWLTYVLLCRVSLEYRNLFWGFSVNLWETLQEVIVQFNLYHIHLIPCFTPPCFSPCFFNAPCQFTTSLICPLSFSG